MPSIKNIILRVAKKGSILSLAVQKPFTKPISPPSKIATIIDPITEYTIRTDRTHVTKLIIDPTVRSKPLTRITTFCAREAASKITENVIIPRILRKERKPGAKIPKNNQAITSRKTT